MQDSYRIDTCYFGRYLHLPKYCFKQWYMLTGLGLDVWQNAGFGECNCACGQHYPCTVLDTGQTNSALRHFNVSPKLQAVLFEYFVSSCLDYNQRVCWAISSLVVRSRIAAWGSKDRPSTSSVSCRGCGCGKNMIDIASAPLCQRGQG